ncbi:hypothetical protein PGTUg99_016113 [Puccinia graminis f. sp. tritici]|uniref:Uncharacterized protein n=1 Tax=Puccinia graminis f. sp. tritici TaxID=56615 RepID=A0A5B0RK17_PUCGR|nr:hypothetical protein PGTUg99_016113 [Puccinia graminis f. sp. tritici]
MSTFYIPVRFANKPQSPYSLQSEQSTHMSSSPAPDNTTPDPSIKSEVTDVPATSTAETAAAEETIESSVPDPVVKSEEADSHAASAVGLTAPCLKKCAPRGALPVASSWRLWLGAPWGARRQLIFCYF